MSKKYGLSRELGYNFLMERKYTGNLESEEHTAELYLSNLGLEWVDLRGKKILDIGALNAEFEIAARRRGVEVTSLDREITAGDYMPPSESQFVVANATSLPFRDEIFDYALAHMSVTNYLEKGYKEEEYLLYIENALREIYRVLKSGGQFHFMNATIVDEELKKNEKDIVPNKASEEYQAWRIEREHQILGKIAKDIGYRELRVNKYPDSHPAKDEYILSHYYVALK